jgi:hypothetical protein
MPEERSRGKMAAHFGTAAHTPITGIPRNRPEVQSRPQTPGPYNLAIDSKLAAAAPLRKSASHLNAEGTQKRSLAGVEVCSLSGPV